MPVISVAEAGSLDASRPVPVPNSRTRFIRRPGKAP